MWTLRLILQSLKKNKARMILMLIQFSVVSFTLIISLGIALNVYYTINSVKKIVPLSTMRINADVYSMPNNKLIEFYTDLQKNSNINKLGSYIVNEDFVYPQSNVVYIDKGLSNIINIDIEQGRTFNDNDFQNSSYVPILVGENFKDKYPVGKTFSVNVGIGNNKKTQINYKVIGSIKKEWKFWIQNRLFGDDTSNTFVTIIPKEFDSYTPLLQQRIANAIFEIKDSNYSDKLNDFINEEIYKFTGHKNDNTNVKNIITFRNMLDASIKQKEIALFYLGTFSAVLVLLSFTGLSGIIMNSIMERKKEIGIRYAIGSKAKDIRILLIGEIFLIVAISNIVASIISALCINIIPKDFGLVIDYKSIFSVIILSLIFTIISVINPIIYLIKLKPIALIRG